MGNNHFDVHFRRIGPYSFLSKDGKDAAREGRNGWKDVYFPPESASSRETPESTRSGRTQNILDPELTQDYISQVSEEIEGRVTKKLSKEFSRTESRILGALSKLDEFLLNPQVRTCSVAVPGTSRSSNLENQGTNEDRPSDDPGPEVEFSSPHFGAETDPHRCKLFSSSKCWFSYSLTVLNRSSLLSSEMSNCRG